MFQRPPPPPSPDPPSRRHIVSAFDEDLTGVVALTVRLGGQAEALTDLALRAMETGDPALAAEAAERRARVAAFARSATTSAAFVLALRQPMAADLRLVLAALRMIPAMERTGELAANIAARGSELRRAAAGAGAGPDDIDLALRRFGGRALSQLSMALSAHQSRDAARARAVWRRDSALDAHFSSLLDSLVAEMEERPQDAARFAQRLFLAKDLERIGDQARRIAAASWWMQSGREIDEAQGPFAETE
ncbi:MAG: PhoU domain-containing protein [Pseudomonadota bacterium]|nr:PhoU domain-containing protein [Pseudomonadota bacterium]